MKLLLVETEPNGKSIGPEAFQNLDFQLAVAFGRDEAEQLIRCSRFDAALFRCDVSTALDLCLHFRAHNRPGRSHLIVVLRGADSTQIQRLIEIGVDDLTFEPIEERALYFRLVTARAKLQMRDVRSDSPQEGAGRLVENGEEILSLLSRDGRVNFSSPATEGVLGYAPKKVEGQSFFDLLHPDDLHRIKDGFLSVCESAGSVRTAEFRCRHINGSWRWMRGTATNLLEYPGVNAVVANCHLIAGLRQSEDAIRLGEQRFRTLFEASPLGILLSRGTRVLYANPAYLRLFGYSPDIDLSGCCLLDHLAPSARGEIIERIERRARGEAVPNSYETTGLRKDGSQFVFHIDVSRVPIQDEVVSVAFITDVTERRQTTRMLELLESAVQQANDAVVITDAEQQWPDTRILFVNQAFVQTCGFAVEDVMGKTPALFEGIAEKKTWREGIRKAVTAGRHFVGESVTCRKDGTSFEAEWHVAPIRNEARVVTHLIATLRDITERKMGEAENQKLAAFARLNPNPVMEFASDGTLSYFNEASLDLARALNQAHPSHVLPTETASIVKRCLSTLRPKVRYETTFGGRTLSWSFFPILASQVVHCYAGDITEKLNLEAQLRQAQKMESIGQLAAGVAHDFNNILTVIQGFTGLLMAESKDSKVTDPLNQISAAAERAANLTRQLLTFSRKQVMQPKVFDLNDVLQNLTKMLQRLLGEHVALQCNYASGLPLIYADTGMIEQIIVNLSVNARDAMPKGGLLTLQTRLLEVDEEYRQRNSEARVGTFVCLTVNDTGCGMDEGTMARIFEPFFTTKEVGKGTGLGLATVYGVVKQHDGWIEVSSRPGEGTTFRVVLPINRKTTDTVFIQKKSPQLTGGTEKVMVVEDEPALRGLAVEILRRFGYTVVEAGSGQEALQVWAIHKETINLVVSDMVMPGGMTGGELVDLLKADKEDLKVIFTSGYSVDIVNQNMSLRDHFHFLQKPYGPSGLLTLVRNILDGKLADSVSGLVATAC